MLQHERVYIRSRCARCLFGITDIQSMKTDQRLTFYHTLVGFTMLQVSHKMSDIYYVSSEIHPQP
jgi:hypothetical protein